MVAASGEGPGAADTALDSNGASAGNEQHMDSSPVPSSSPAAPATPTLSDSLRATLSDSLSKALYYCAANFDAVSAIRARNLLYRATSEDDLPPHLKRLGLPRGVQPGPMFRQAVEAMYRASDGQSRADDEVILSRISSRYEEIRAEPLVFPRRVQWSPLLEEVHGYQCDSQPPPRLPLYRSDAQAEGLILRPLRDTRLAIATGSQSSSHSEPHSPPPALAQDAHEQAERGRELDTPMDTAAAPDLPELDLANIAAIPLVEPTLGGDAPAVLLFILTLTAPAAFLLPAGGALPPLTFGAHEEAAGLTAGGLRKSAMQRVGGWLTAAFGALLGLQSLLVGDTAEGQRVVVTPVRVVPARSQLVTTPAEAVLRRATSPPGTFLFFTLAALAGSSLYNPAMTAVSKCVSLIRPADDIFGADGLRTGAMTLRPVVPRAAGIGTGGDTTIGDALASCSVSDALLRQYLDVPVGDPDFEFLHSSIDRVGGCDLSELYSDDGLLSQPAPGFGGDDLALAPFSATISPPVTDYLDEPGVGATKPRRQPDHCYEPTFTAPTELLEGWCLRALADWLELLEADTVTIAEGNYEDRWRRPEPFVAGQDCFVPSARGCVWDLRRAREGIIEPLDFSSKLHSQLDIDYVDKSLPDWPDQRLLAYLHDGVHFEFDMPLQWVLHPHLYSVWHGFSSLQKEARRLQGNSYETRWAELFARMPFAPMWLLPHGATPRKLEPDRWRSTTEGGAPRHELYDTEGKPVRSINERSREYAHPQEVKPTPEQFAQDVAVLNSGSSGAIAKCTTFSSSTERPPGFYSTFVATDDVADYFMHLATAPELWWYSTYAVVALATDPDLDIGSRLRFVVEYSISFGVVCSSGYAQRFSMLILALVEIELQSLLQEHWPDWRQDPCYSPWLDARELHLGRDQARLHTTKMYTDDAALAASSVRMFVLLLRAWHRATSKLNLRMAIAAKRFLGTTVIWLGVGFAVAAGILFIPRNKILRATSALRQSRGGKLTVQLTLSLLGLLEHLRGVMFGDRNWMFGLWALAGEREHPAATPHPDDFAVRSIDRWIKRLLQGGTVSALSAFARKAISGVQAARDELSIHASPMNLHIWPDAARQRLVADRRGIGAWCHGFVFCIPIAALGMELLPISVLELLAALVALLTFGILSPSSPLRLHTDSLTSFYGIAEESGRAPAGQYALGRFHTLPSAQALRERLEIDHTYGEGNVGDLPSRGKWRELFRLAAQLGARVRQAVVPAEGLQLIRDTLRFEGERQRVPRDRLLILCQETTQHFPRLDPQRTEGADLHRLDEELRYSALSRAIAARSAASSHPPPPADSSSALAVAGSSSKEGSALSRAIASSQPALRPSGKKRSLAAFFAPQPPLPQPAEAPAAVGGTLGSLKGSERVSFADLQAQRRGRMGSGMGKGIYALNPTDPGLLSQMSQRLGGFHSDAQNERSHNKDMGHWNQYWEPICRLFNTSSIRDAPGAATGTDVEAQSGDVNLLCFALILIMTIMQPRKRSSPAAQPQSGFQVLLAVARVHKLLGVVMVPLKFVRLTLRGMLQRFVRVHGHDALVPSRKWPMSHRILTLLLHITSVRFGTSVWTADSLLGVSTIAMVCLLYASGFRKAEITTHGLGVTYLTRASLRWFINGSVCEPTAANLARAGPGSYVECYPRESKCDFTGEVWGDKPTIHHWGTERGNAFCALAALETARPVSGPERILFPLFCESDGTAVSETRAARILAAMLETVLPASEAQHYTWHSFRHGLATRLRKANCPADVIMQLCRWQTIQSLRTYARLDASQYRHWHDASFDSAFTEGPSEQHHLDSAHAMVQLHEDDSWDREADTQPRTPRAGRAPAAHTATSAASTLPPLTVANARRRLVLVPSARYPTHACNEHDGKGWEAQILSATRITAVVRYLYARTADGRVYEDTREPIGCLEPLT